MKKKLLVLVLMMASSCMVQARWDTTGPGRWATPQDGTTPQVGMPPQVGMTPQEGTVPQVDALASAEAEQLIYLREEEKLAHDVYVTLFNTWGHFVFDNISRAEQKHTDSTFNMLSSYGLDDPAQTQVGLFTNGELQHLYDSLVSRGTASELEAFMVGALIEEVDMQDLDEMIAGTQNENLINHYEKLLCGSRNHLRAFVQQIESQGVVYEAQLMTQEAVDQIVDSSMERGCGRM